MQSGSAFFLVAVLGLVVAITYIFILFMVLGGILCLTSHTTILNLPQVWVDSIIFYFKTFSRCFLDFLELGNYIGMMLFLNGSFPAPMKILIVMLMEEI